MYNSFTHHYIIGKEVFFYETTPSTNSTAQKLLAQGRIGDGGIVIAERQTEGKGQRGHTWESEGGANLTFTIVLKLPFLDLNRSYLLNMFITTSILCTLRKFQPIGFQIKWPNDIYFNNKKIGGILIENSVRGKRLESTLIGIGLNINQLQFSIGTATSLAQITGRNHNLQSFFSALISELDSSYRQFRLSKFRSFKSEFLRNLMGFDKFHQYRKAEGTFEARMLDVEDDGCLVLEYEGKRERFYHKEVFQLVV